MTKLVTHQIKGIIVLSVLVGGVIFLSVTCNNKEGVISTHTGQDDTYAVERVAGLGDNNDNSFDRYSESVLIDHIYDIKPRVPEGFTIVVQEPFVVIGNEAPEVVRRRSKETVRWFVEHIRQMYFPRDPDVIYDIWLFRDDQSYRRYSQELFSMVPDTPFGFFSPRGEALVMNIETGGGTLCHEIVHAMMPENFPECPVWFNEGLASLYEQCQEREGRLVGLTNWRLKGLQQNIQAQLLVPFTMLMQADNAQFYNENKGDHYAQARYLCYFLQEKDLLVKYYREFVENVSNDPTGYETLKSILGIHSENEMDEFQRDWEKWVLGLRF
ncbi:MAG: hypothetical protein GY869_30480 [Planctomycetes bacterium]|nr:hypothetical protein [Planctomycetota bacterium]